MLLDRFGEGAAVAVLGADGLRDALREAGLRPVGVDDDAVAVVTGYGPDVVWHEVMRVATRIRDGLPWVASNTDLTLPVPGGVRRRDTERWCGCSRTSPGSTPEVAGKPAPPLLEETIRRVGGSRPLMVGDRLDTDIEGGRRAEVDSLLVLTGVTGLADLVAAGPELRPTYLAADLGGLLEVHQAPERRDDGLARGWLDGPRRPTAGSTVEGDGQRRTTGGGPRRRPPGSTWTPSGEPVDTGGLLPPAAAPDR